MKRRPSALAITLVVLLVAVLATAGVVAWQVVGTDMLARSRADKAISAAREQWKKPAKAQAPSEGEVIGVLRSVKLGRDWPIVAGVAPDQLRSGAVGWYPQTSMPGRKGNTALAGLRITHGSPFRALLDLERGDVLTIDTADGSWTYSVRAPAAVVDAGASGSWVLAPVPGGKHDPTTSVLTLTTAADVVATQRRAVVFAELVEDK